MILKPKGTKDIYDIEGLLYKNLEALIDDYMNLYNISYMRTPIFEYSELFYRGVGETTDIVTKETYDLKDRGDRSLTLRPEGTASVVRSFIENKLYGNQNDTLKYYYFGTMYRYERPQAGRFREFTQFGIEFFNTSNPLIDAEVISVGYNIFQELGFENLIVEINSLGDEESREKYKEALKKYLKPNLNKLCSDCQKRFDTNPLRIIDCKYDQDNEVLKNIPTTIDYLSEKSLQDLEDIKNMLINLEVNFVVNPKIVRGLDYYTGVVFEYNLDDVIYGGGGRYDNLIKDLEGPSIPATGFALGIDRIMINLLERIDEDKLRNNIDAFIMSVSEEEKHYALKISQSLRLNGIIADFTLNDISFNNQFKIADKKQAKYLIILNDDLLKKGLVVVKDNVTKEEVELDEVEIIDYFLQNI